MVLYKKIELFFMINSHLNYMISEFNQVLHNVTTQLRLFTTVGNMIWGVMHTFLVELQEVLKLVVFQNLRIVNFFGTQLDFNCVLTKTNYMAR